MPEDLDFVDRYARSQGLFVRPRTILLEGTTDVALFKLAARLEREATGIELLSPDLAVVAAGEGDLGGCNGVVRELNVLRGLARAYLLPNGRPRYRFIGVLDNDDAGRRAVSLARTFDRSILECKDLFLLWPIMPLPGSLDPVDIKGTIERANAGYRGIDWEIEDLISDAFIDDFSGEYPFAIKRTTAKNEKTHRELSQDGKAQLHRFVRQYAIRDDLIAVIECLKALRYYLGLKS